MNKLALWLTLSAAGCSVVDRADAIRQAPCSSDLDCEVLNARRDVDFDPCFPYACRPAGFCERAVLDADHDGYPAPGCSDGQTPRDCDDSATGAAVHPGAAESCNQRDDDCDGQLDEGLLRAETESVLELAETLPLSTLTFALDAEQSKLLLAYVTPSDGHSVALHELDLTAPASPLSLPLQLPRVFESAPQPLALGLGYLPQARLALVSFVDDSVPRVLAGSLQWNDPSWGLSPRIARYGLSCAPSETCAQNAAASSDSTPAGTPPSSHFALATSPAGTLVMYARVPPPTAASYGCGAGGEPEQLLANLLVSGVSDLAERTPHASEIAMTDGPDSAALLALPASPKNVQQGFLAAFSDDSGALVVYQLRPTADHTGVEHGEPLLRLPPVAGGWHAPQLAFGNRVSADVYELGLVAVRGCALERRVVGLRARIQARDSAELAIYVTRPAEELGPADPNSEGSYAPALVWNGLRQVWGIAYRDGASVRAQTLSEDFAALGGEYVLATGPAIAEASGAQLAIAAATSGASPFTVFHQQRASDGSYGVARSQLGACGAP